MKRYCLANYILTVNVPESINLGISSISIGGEGSYLNNITVLMNKAAYEISTDDTGSWVYNKSLDKSGSISLTINQMSDKVAILKKLLLIYSKSDVDTEGLTLSLRDTANNTIFIAEDCMLGKLPEQVFSTTAGTQNWSFNSGRISFED